MEYIKELKCGCAIRKGDTTLDFWVDYCPLHKSAPKLYEACKTALELSHDPKVGKILLEALAEAEGK